MNLSVRFILFSALLAMPIFATAADERSPQHPAPVCSPVLFGEAEPFNDGWKFTLSDPTDAASPEFDDSRWRQLDLPHDWSVEGDLSPSLASCTGYLPGGIGWYRTLINSRHLANHGGRGDGKRTGKEKYYLYFEGVYNRSEVYLNGHLLGKRPNGYTSFCYDLTPYLHEGDNVLAVRVDHSRYADSRWYTGSGIYRNVWLVRAPETHLAQWGTTYRLTAIDASTACIEVESTIERPTQQTSTPTATHNSATADRPLQLAITIYDRDNRPVARKRVRVAATQTKITAPLTIPKPHRWELTDPYLYTMQVDLLDGGKRIDRCRTRIGLRTLEFDADKGFALNGRWMKVKGVCLHHDAGTLGAAVPPEVWRRRLENLKAIGVNAIRMSHNPQAPALYDLCDELGLLVMDEASDEWEFPKRKWLTGWNDGTPGYDGTYDFFEEWIDRDVADMVRRDRNHPSIFLWSIGNEVDYPNDPYSHPVLDSIRITQKNYRGYNPDAPDARRIGKIAERLVRVVKSHDTSRPTTGAMAGVAMSNATSYPDAIDVCGYNYTENRYDLDHATYPHRIIYGSENRSDYGAWRAVCDRNFIFGQFIWTGIDYLGESRSWPSRGFYSGLLDFGGFVKPRGHFRASLWSDRPVTYIGTYPADDKPLSIDAWDIWNYDAGDTIRVVCYTNAPQARLLLDGAPFGETKPYDDRTGIIHWDVPYRAGELRAEGLDAEGKVLSDYTIVSSDVPRALRVEADKQVLSADKETVHLCVEVVDAEGRPVRLGDNEITCEITGPARLLGLENANNSDMTDYTDNRHRAYHGRLLAYVRTTGEAGDITVRFTSPLLKGCRINLRAK